MTHPLVPFNLVTDINKLIGPVPSASDFRPTTPLQPVYTLPEPTDYTPTAYMPTVPALINPDPGDVTATPAPVNLNPSDMATDPNCAKATSTVLTDPILVNPNPIPSMEPIVIAPVVLTSASHIIPIAWVSALP